MEQGGQLARNAFHHLLGQALPLVIGLVTMPVIVRGLGPDRFGVLSLAWALIAYFTIFDLGLGRAATKVISEKLKSGAIRGIGAVLWGAIAMQAVLGLAGAALLVAIATLLVHQVAVPAPLVTEALVGLRILAVGVPIYLVIGSLRGALEAAQRFDLVNLVRGPFLSMYFLVPLAGALLKLSLVWILGGLVVSSVLALVAYWCLCVRQFPMLGDRQSLSWLELRGMLQFGSWVSVSSIVAPILVHLDRFVVGALLTVSWVAYYAAPYEMITRLWIVPSTLASILFPAFSALAVGGDLPQLRSLWKHSVRHVVATLGPLVAVLVPFSTDVVGIMFGADYGVRSAAVLQVLAVGVLLNSLAWVPSALIQSVGRPDLTAKIHLVEVPIHVTLLFVLVGQLGIVGAALAWTLRALIDTVLVAVLASQLLGMRVADAFTERLAQTLAILAGTGLAAYGAAALLASPGPRVASLCVLLALSGVLSWRYILDHREREHLLAMLQPRAINA